MLGSGDDYRLGNLLRKVLIIGLDNTDPACFPVHVPRGKYRGGSQHEDHSLCDVTALPLQVTALSKYISGDGTDERAASPGLKRMSSSPFFSPWLLPTTHGGRGNPDQEGVHLKGTTSQQQSGRV